MKRKRTRLIMIGVIGAVLLSAVLLVLFALRDEIIFFYSPSDIISQQKAVPGNRIRLGGLVKLGSINKIGDRVEFIITDTDREMNVVFNGLLPDLFREGQGVIAEGRLNDDLSFSADNVLAKHDENYMPREVADKLREKGVWQGDDDQ